MSEEKILFLCTGYAEGCARTHCYKNGGECMHTTEVKYAKNFQDHLGVFTEKEDRQIAEMLSSILEQNDRLLKKLKLSMRKKYKQ